MKIRTILFVSGMQAKQLFPKPKQCAAPHPNALYTGEHRKQTLCSTKAQRKQTTLRRAKRSRPQAASLSG
ncbi:hypothetical protein [Paraburkholderia solisilvae]|uniref:hypothetical protein n=1 Tax=Paraburkholderia solisilvae TaxID=624376 RepID=UPI0015833B19|nr:hypothetical protein [Paraburkholderia solisilvae]